MKVLIAGVCSSLGGMERRMEAEARVLRGLGHQVIIATPFFEQLPEWRAQLAAQGIEHVQWSPYKVFERMHLSWPFRLLALASAPKIRKLNLDLAVLFVPWNFIGMSMATVLRHLRIPYLLSIHCLLGRQATDRRAKALLIETLRSCYGAYGVSRPVTESFQCLYGEFLNRRIRVRTILNGVDVDRFSPDPSVRLQMRALLGLSPESRVVLFCGRLDSVKRPLLAAQAFAALHRRDPKAHLVIVGSGPSLADMQAALAPLVMCGVVHFIGHTTDPVSYFRLSDCYLSTSSSEGFSLTAAEALSSGLPAVVPDDSVFRGIYGRCDRVLFCSTAVPEDWATGLQTILASWNIHNDRGLAGSRQYAIQNLSLAAMEESLRDFYRGIENELVFKSSPCS